MQGALLSLDPAAGPALARKPAFVDVLVAYVARLAQRRKAWLEHLGRTSGARSGQHAELVLSERDDVEAERVWYGANQDLVREIEGYRGVLEGPDSPLAQLAQTFGLAQPERDLLAVCLALELEPALSAQFAEVQRGRGYVTDSLAARLCGRGRTLLLDPSGALRRWDLVRAEDAAAGEPAALRVDAHVLAFALGRGGLDPALIGISNLIAPHEPLASWPVEALTRRIERALERGTALRVTLCGPRGSGRKTLAAAVSAALGASALGLDTTRIPEGSWAEACLHAHRQAVLSGMALVWHGEHVGRQTPPLSAVAPLQFVIGELDVALPAQPGVADERFEMPRLDIEERRALWLRLVPAVRAWPAGDLDHVVERYRVTVGDVATIAANGVTLASEAAALCRSLTRSHLGELGELVDCPFDRHDLVLPAKIHAILDDFLFEARERARFWENDAARRLFPRGTGLIALMTGPPGTGKTMAAQVIAAELGLDLFRIDLATCVSKYIGETAKNLRRIFARASEMNAVMLFDEADALFTKRTEVKDAHDRYANTDTNYLLQLIEDYEGVALLATNKRQNIDTAFVRRMRYVLELQRPGAAERRTIWRRLVQELTGAALDAELGAALDRIADAIDLSGAQIKLALLGAMFAARRSRQPLGLPHLHHGIARELAKEGRSVSASERERIDRHV